MKGILTEDAAFRPTDSVLKCINQKMHVGGIFCVLAKTFVCVKHEILLAKLDIYGIRGVSTDKLRSYLINRKQKVAVKSPNTNKDFLPYWGTLKCGIPQGSILGPLLFITYIFINDLSLSINSVSLPILFADVTSVTV